MTAPAVAPSGIGLQAVPQADRDRRDLMRSAWKAYRGDWPDPLKVESGQPNDNVKPNRCKPIVDKVVSWLFGHPLKIEATTSGDAGQKYLDSVWRYDDYRMTLLAKVALNGAVCGEAFIKILPANPKAGLKYPRFVVLDPAIVRVVTAPDDCDLVLAFVIEYDIPASPMTIHKRQVIARVDPDNLAGYTDDFDLDDSWTITNYESRDNQTWHRVGDVDDSWEWPFPPIVYCQNNPNPNEFWGMPDLTSDIIAMNKVISFIESNGARIIKYHGHPVTWASGVGTSPITWKPDELLVLPSVDAKIGTLAPIANLTAILDFLENLRADMDEYSRVPAVALGRQESLPKGNLSGVALQMLFQPIIELTRMKQRLYGDLIRQASRAVLVMGGFCTADAWEECEVNLPWANLLPIDDLAAAQTAVALQTLGVSNDTLMQELGYDADVEAEKSAKEDAKKLSLYAQGQGTPPGMAMQPPQLQAQQLQQQTGNEATP